MNMALGGLLEPLFLKWRQSAYRRKASRWLSLEKAGGSFTARIEPGIKMRFYLDSKLSRLIYLEDFERLERSFLIRFLRPGDIFVDVGANVGLFALTAARCVGAKGRVYAFEPFGRICERLKENVGLNGFKNVSCERLALSEEEGEGRMTVSMDGYDAWNSLGRPISGNRFSVEKVRCVSWDKFAERNNLVGRVAMMKLDVEGWEGHVLAGACRTLSRDDAPLLQVEFTDEANRGAGFSSSELYRLLESFGYRMYAYDRDSRKFVPDPLRKSYPYVNLMASKRPEAVERRLG